MAGFEVASAAIAFGMLVATSAKAWLLFKQYRRARDNAWSSTQAAAFLKEHPPSSDADGDRQQQFDIDATLQGANYLDAGPWETLEFPDESRLYCLDQNRCQWVRAITLGARLRRFLRDARSPHP